MGIGSAVIRPLKDALDGMPVHTRQLADMFRKHGQKQRRNNDGVTDLDRPGDRPNTPNTPDNRPYLTPGSRPSLRKGTIRDVWNNAKGPDGLVREPYPPYSVITWTPGTPRQGVWDMGHLPEHHYHEKWQEYVDGGMTPAEFRDWYNDAGNYRPELPGPNRGHLHE